MIDLVEWRLKSESVETVKLMGYMPIAQRRSVLQAFKTDPNIQVILMSLKAGGEGLNLQEANHVLVLEPWWNPQVELQAIQRAHRIGQTKDVKAVRFITDDTIEERMLELQVKKQLIFDGAVDSSAASLSQLTQVTAHMIRCLAAAFSVPSYSIYSIIFSIAFGGACGTAVDLPFLVPCFSVKSTLLFVPFFSLTYALLLM